MVAMASGPCPCCAHRQYLSFSPLASLTRSFLYAKWKGLSHIEYSEASISSVSTTARKVLRQIEPQPFTSLDVSRLTLFVRSFGCFSCSGTIQVPINLCVQRIKLTSKYISLTFPHSPLNSPPYPFYLFLPFSPILHMSPTMMNDIESLKRYPFPSLPSVGIFIFSASFFPAFRSSRFPGPQNVYWKKECLEGKHRRRCHQWRSPSTRLPRGWTTPTRKTRTRRRMSINQISSLSSCTVFRLVCEPNVICDF